MFQKEQKENPIKSSPAYAEVLLRKVELESTLEDLSVSYTDKYPKIQQIRYEIEKLNQELNRLLATNPNNASKLTIALGKLIVRKVQLEVDLWFLLQDYTEEADIVKRTRKKLSIFENAIKEIMQ
jgi:uncharacterized protein involved in exopolysaccharide biosynthesis